MEHVGQDISLKGPCELMPHQEALTGEKHHKHCGFQYAFLPVSTCQGIACFPHALFPLPQWKFCSCACIIHSYKSLPPDPELAPYGALHLSASKMHAPPQVPGQMSMVNGDWSYLADLGIVILAIGLVPCWAHQHRPCGSWNLVQHSVRLFLLWDEKVMSLKDI